MKNNKTECPSCLGEGVVMEGKKTTKGSFSGNLNEVLSALSYPFNLNVENISINKINLKEKHR